MVREIERYYWYGPADEIPCPADRCLGRLSMAILLPILLANFLRDMVRLELVLTELARPRRGVPALWDEGHTVTYRSCVREMSQIRNSMDVEGWCEESASNSVSIMIDSKNKWMSIGKRDNANETEEGAIIPRSRGS